MKFGEIPRSGLGGDVFLRKWLTDDRQTDILTEGSEILNGSLPLQMYMALFPNPNLTK